MPRKQPLHSWHRPPRWTDPSWRPSACGDRKSTRLNSSHLVISYAVFCLKKKKLDSAIKGQYLIPDDVHRVQRRLHGVATVAADVAVQDLLSHLGIGHYTLAVADQLCLQCVL